MPQIPSSTNVIQKTVTLRAPRSRVWQALTDAEKFGTWFLCKLEGPFVEGHETKGHITNPGWEHLRVSFKVERIEPETLFSYRWHPYPIDSTVDYSTEKPTLVEMRLEELENGTRLTVTETGFEDLPAERRAEAFRMNDGGWSAQLRNVALYVED
jgi:uncharacterized protein YndB with AHSA1/START domain